MNRVAITGASGFIGKALYKELVSRNLNVLPITRSERLENIKSICIGNIDGKTNWNNTLTGVTTLVHCAGIAHNMSKDSKDNLQMYQSINVDGTINLARSAVSQGVKRFIFLSSVKVLGEKTNPNESFHFDDVPNPEDNYGLSKYLAERKLLEISKKTGLEVVIIRPSLVYGPGVKGNINRLMRFIGLGLPIPFGLIKNKRSLIGLDNLTDFLVRCIEYDQYLSDTFLLSDGEDISTPDLIRMISLSMQSDIRLLNVPVSIIKFFGFILRKKSEVNRLTNSLVIDNSHACKVLNWKPLVPIDIGIKNMVNWHEKNL